MKIPEPPIKLAPAERRLYDDQHERMQRANLWTDAKTGVLAQWARLTLEVEKLKKLYTDEPATVLTGRGTDRRNPKLVSLEGKEKELRKTADRLLSAPRTKAAVFDRYGEAPPGTPKVAPSKRLAHLRAERLARETAPDGRPLTFDALCQMLDADLDPLRLRLPEDGEKLGDMFDTFFTNAYDQMLDDMDRPDYEADIAWRVKLQGIASRAQNLLLYSALAPDAQARYTGAVLPLPTTVEEAREHLASPHARASLRSVPAYVAQVTALLQAEGAVAKAPQKARQRRPVPTAAPTGKASKPPMDERPR